MYRELSVTLRLDDIAHRRVDDELDFGIWRYVEQHIHIHHTLRAAHLTLFALVSHHSTCEEGCCISLISSLRLKGHKVGGRDIRLTRKRHKERRVIATRSVDIYLHTELVAVEHSTTRGIYVTIEKVVVLLCSVEHKHILDIDANVVYHIREVLQI